jgi:hypothetical protein
LPAPTEKNGRTIGIILSIAFFNMDEVKPSMSGDANRRRLELTADFLIS